MQTSSASGFTAPSVSSQSVASATAPLGASQDTLALKASPKPSESASVYQVEASTALSSSMSPSQLLSMASHTSLCPGLAAAVLSSQSVASLTWPLGSAQATVVLAASPKPSPSVSAYQVSASAAVSGSMIPSQSSSTPLQTSVASGFTAASPSSQSWSSEV